MAFFIDGRSGLGKQISKPCIGLVDRQVLGWDGSMFSATIISRNPQTLHSESKFSKLYLVFWFVTIIITAKNFVITYFSCSWDIRDWIFWKGFWERVRHFKVTLTSNFVYLIPQISEWKAFYDSATPQTEPLPEPWEDDLNKLQHLIVLRCLRPDKVKIAKKLFCTF